MLANFITGPYYWSRLWCTYAAMLCPSVVCPLSLRLR